MQLKYLQNNIRCAKRRKELVRLVATIDGQQKMFDGRPIKLKGATLVFEVQPFVNSHLCKYETDIHTNNIQSWILTDRRINGYEG